MKSSTNLNEAQTEAIKHAVRLLIEHFDAVQIFASKHDMASDETQSVSFGVGNHFARACQVERWVEDNYVTEEDD